MTKFQYSNALSKIENPLIWDDHKSELMVKACKEMALFHYNNCPEIKYLYQKKNFNPETIESETDLLNIPSLGVSAMKYFLFTSRDKKYLHLKLTSSGTKGQKTQIWFDQESLERVQSMLESLWRQEGLVSQQKVNYLLFIYDPKDAQDLGIAFTINNQKRFAPENQIFFTIQKDHAGEWQFLKEDTLNTLFKFQQQNIPVRISGIPSFIYDFLLEMHERITLPKGSVLLTGGGWKAAEEKKVSKEKFRVKVMEHLGICEGSIRDGYGMAEHSSPYIECKNHRFHVPAFNRIFVRDPATMKALTPGEIGLLELVTPFNSMMPNLSILSTDLGFIDPAPCECGYNSPTFSLIGRGGLQKHKGCAIHANEIIKR